MRGQLIRVLYSENRPHPVAHHERDTQAYGRGRDDAAGLGL